MTRRRGVHRVAGRRLLVAAVVGVLAGVAAAIPLGFEFRPVVGWVVGDALFLTWT